MVVVCFVFFHTVQSVCLSSGIVGQSVNIPDLAAVEINKVETGVLLFVQDAGMMGPNGSEQLYGNRTLI